MSSKFSTARLRLRALHRYTAYFILIFLVFHIGNHLSGLFGFDTYNRLQGILRTIYRNPIIEPILIFSVILQLCVGLALMIKSLKQSRPKNLWSWLQLISGILILLTISEHLIALYLARVVSDLDTNFYWPLSVMDGAPFTYYFVPYYFLMVSSVFVHAATGLHFIGRDRNYSARVDTLAIGLIVIGILIAAVIVLILNQTFYDVPLPPEWIDYLRQFSPEYTSPR